MASELSRFIEDELKQRGFYEEEKKGLIKDTPSRTSNALRFESRVKDQQESAKAKTLTRNMCIIGGILLVVVVWIVLISSSGGEGITDQYAGEEQANSKTPSIQKEETTQKADVPIVPVVEKEGNETVEEVNGTDIEANTAIPTQESATPTPTPTPPDNTTDTSTTKPENTTTIANNTLIATPLPETETINSTKSSTTPKSP
eukprot:TRINITY_DN47953_c0_g1_i5.p1 TRINITY_DN47953_c0_g1~~TRINITY_DN47953_c0_g1_i5.p1  ORF type:complete len:228 (-),score=65.29 TRINITY_DN47953_c0_g1_i5:303-908(-)